MPASGAPPLPVLPEPCWDVLETTPNDDEDTRAEEPPLDVDPAEVPPPEDVAAADEVSADDDTRPPEEVAAVEEEPPVLVLDEVRADAPMDVVAALELAGLPLDAAADADDAAVDADTAREDAPPEDDEELPAGGSTQVLSTQTRAPLQSLSVAQPSGSRPVQLSIPAPTTNANSPYPVLVIVVPAPCHQQVLPPRPST
jgi:hypothetical protein